jgi:hypothetical protein
MSIKMLIFETHNSLEYIMVNNYSEMHTFQFAIQSKSHAYVSCYLTQGSYSKFQN